MATKQEVIDFLEESIRTEESAVPIYAKHIDNALFFSEFDVDLQKHIKQALSRLYRESCKHDTIFRGLLERIKQENRDVY